MRLKPVAESLSRALIGAGSLLLPTAAALAQAGAAPAGGAPASGATSLDTVVLLGTSRPDVQALQSASPVDVIPREELERSGAANLSQALQQLVPSFHFPQGSSSNVAGSAVRGVSLRGLGVDQTLVLVNGQRRHASAALSFGSTDTLNNGTTTVDLTAIPISAVERVEVLRDGASAKYGSDAIAGVINIVLRRSAEGGGVTLRAGQYSDTDGNEIQSSAWLATRLPGRGFVNLSVDTNRRDRLAQGDIDPSLQYYFAGDPREKTVDRTGIFSGLGASSRFNAALNAELGLSDSLRAYGSALLGRKKDDGYNVFRTPRDNGTVRALWPDGMTPRLVSTSGNASLAAGLKLNDEALGRFDANVGFGRNKVSGHLYETDNASLGLASPTDFYVGNYINQQTQAALNWDRAFEGGFWPGSLTASGGLSWRRERFAVGAGETNSWIGGGQPVLDGPSAGAAAPAGSQGYPGSTPSDAGAIARTVYGLHLGLENQINDQWLLDLAARAEHYSDFGSTVNGQASVRYDVTPSLGLRGTVGSGYRAPAIGQLVYSRTQFQNVAGPNGGTLLAIRTLPVSSPAARALGSQDLTPEKSRNLSLGVVWQPSANASLTVDAYQITVRDRIVLSERIAGTLVTQALKAAGFADISAASFFLNGPDTRTRGVDVVGRWRQALSGGATLDWSAGLNLADTRILRIPANPSQLDGANIVLYSRRQQGLLTDGTPDSTLRLAGTWQWQAWSVSLSTTRYGEFTLFNNTTSDRDQTFSPQWVADLQLGWQATSALRLALGADNLLGSHPDKLRVASRDSYVKQYTSLSPAGATGRFVYASASLSF